MKDNSTGKTVGFYERGQAIFDRIPKEEKKMKISTAEIDKALAEYPRVKPGAGKRGDLLAGVERPDNYWADLGSTKPKDVKMTSESCKVALTDERLIHDINTELDLEKQGAACRKLFASVMTTAIRDATIAPTRNTGTVHAEARSAVAFLFSDRCEVYLHFLDIDPKYFRNSLVECMSNKKNTSKESMFSKLVTPVAQKSFMYNYRHLMAGGEGMC